MLSKTRTTVITLVAAFSFGGAAMVPTVAQAKPKKKVAVTCPDQGLGSGTPGQIIEYNVIGDDGKFHIEKKICGLDGKWHTCTRSGSPESPTSGIVPPVVGGIKGSPTPAPVTVPPTPPLLK